MSGLLIHHVASGKERRVLPGMPRGRRDKLDATVAMLVVVPAHERQDPRPGGLQRGKPLGRICRPVFTGPEESFRERIVIADSWPTVRGHDPQALQRGAERRPFHWAAVVGMQDQRLQEPSVRHDRPVHDRRGMLAGFLFEDLPADDLATIEIENQIEVEEQAFDRARQPCDIP